jgi:hypothetical protein
MIKVSKHKLKQAAATRPPEYESQIAAAAQREDDQYYYFSSRVYSELFEKYRGQQYQPVIVEQASVTPWQQRLVALVSKLRTPEDRGVGDTLERMLAKVGGRKIKHLLRLANLPCRCDDRQRWLNTRFPYFDGFESQLPCDVEKRWQ